MGRLDSLKDDLAVEHAEIGPEVLCQTIVPVFEFTVGTSWSLGATACLVPLNSVVEVVFWTETSIKLVFKAIHEGTIARGLGSIVLNTSVANNSSVPVVKLGFALASSTFVRISASTATATKLVAHTIKVHG